MTRTILVILYLFMCFFDLKDKDVFIFMLLNFYCFGFFLFCFLCMGRLELIKGSVYQKTAPECVHWLFISVFC